MENNIVGKKIRQVRKEHGYSQRNLAKELGITGSYLSKIEKGQTLSIPLLEKIAQFFDLHTSYFFTDDEELNDFSNNEKSLLFEPNLSLDNIKEKYNFIKYKDREVTDDELKIMLDVLEAYRNSKNQESDD